MRISREEVECAVYLPPRYGRQSGAYFRRDVEVRLAVCREEADVVPDDFRQIGAVRLPVKPPPGFGGVFFNRHGLSRIRASLCLIGELLLRQTLAES
ncbi:MAG: hypothetical protein LBP76_01805 [Treponema sp.]|nr:hypothetical protein [Treponema sp.]